MAGSGTRIQFHELKSSNFADEATTNRTLLQVTKSLSSLATDSSCLYDQQGRSTCVAVAIFPSLHFSEDARILHRLYLLRFLEILQQFRTSCQSCRLVLVTPTSQHFPWLGGAYHASKRNSIGFNASEAACAPWSPGQGNGTSSLLAEWPRAAWPSDWPLPARSANTWRAGDTVDAAASFPGMLLVPLHWLTKSWAGAHPEFRPSVKALDCTHFCQTPFAFEPFWWAVHIVADTRYFESERKCVFVSYVCANQFPVIKIPMGIATLPIDGRR